MSAGPSPRPRLSNGMIAFILVDVVLVLAVVIVAFVTFRGPGAPSSPTATSTTTSSATPSATAGQDAPAPVERTGTARTFASPSGNITCTIDENGARCGIANLANDPAPVEGCDGSVGHVYVVTTAGVPEVPCVPKNEKPKKAGKKVDVLGYGEVAREFGYTCTSEEAGVTCTDDTTGRGFTLARAGGEIR
jgi:hypothetical protein